ncbi:MAG TPA: helix-turn-helix domain-containing protein [Mucilaginibacter sp.]|nr:helix-turn-helix domain-containing protein [Mucilaginibacter sp.]
MSNYQSKDTEVAFEDLRNLIKEEFAKAIQELKGLKQHTKPLDIGQVAERYAVSKATIHNWIKQGIVTGFKQGKGRFFHMEELEENLTKYRYLDPKGLLDRRKQISM